MKKRTEIYLLSRYVVEPNGKSSTFDEKFYFSLNTAEKGIDHYGRDPHTTNNGVTYYWKLEHFTSQGLVSTNSNENLDNHDT